MKYISALLIILIWSIATLFLAFTVIGLVVVLLGSIEADYGWFNIPKDALKAFNPNASNQKEETL